jgi:hypothetical protein
LTTFGARPSHVAFFCTTQINNIEAVCNQQTVHFRSRSSGEQRWMLAPICGSIQHFAVESGAETIGWIVLPDRIREGKIEGL